MNIIKWAKQNANKKTNIAKNKKARKQLEKNIPKLTKRKGIIGTIAERKERQRKLLEEISK